MKASRAGPERSDAGGPRPELRLERNCQSFRNFECSARQARPAPVMASEAAPDPAAASSSESFCCSDENWFCRPYVFPVRPIDDHVIHACGHRAHSGCVLRATMDWNSDVFTCFICSERNSFEVVTPVCDPNTRDDQPIVDHYEPWGSRSLRANGDKFAYGSGPL